MHYLKFCSLVKLKGCSEITLSILLHLTLIVVIFLCVHKLQGLKTIKLNIYNAGGITVKVINQPAKKKSDTKADMEVKHKKSALTVKNKPPSQPVNKVKNTGTGGTIAANAKVITLDKNSKILNYNPPNYPPIALELKQQGTVIVRLLVNKENQIVAKQLYKSSGYKLLDQAVMSAVKDWKMQQNIDQVAWLEVKINFVIQ